MSLLTIGTITLALLIISLFMLFYVNMEGTLEQWSSKIAITVYYEKELAPLEITSLKNGIMALGGADSVTYTSKEEALKRFRARLKGQETLLEGVGADILPASLEVTLKKQYRSTEAVSLFVAALKRMPGVGEIQYGEEWVRKFLSFFQFLRVIGFLVGGFLLLSVLFIVSNTIKLTILARKDELEILGLVGATPLFIKTPFLLEAMFQGAVGAILAITILTAGYFAVLSNAGNFLSFNPAATGLIFLPPVYVAGIIIGGILLGFIGSLASLKKFITI
jgi:cell division transport system permease protein